MIEPTLVELWRLILLVIGAFAGTTFAVATKHLTTNNHDWDPEDLWYYVLAIGVSIGAWIFAADYTTGFIATSGINTPLALTRNAVKWRTGNGKAVDRPGDQEGLGTVP